MEYQTDCGDLYRSWSNQETGRRVRGHTVFHYPGHHASLFIAHQRDATKGHTHTHTYKEHSCPTAPELLQWWLPFSQTPHRHREKFNLIHIEFKCITKEDHFDAKKSRITRVSCNIGRECLTLTAVLVCNRRCAVTYFSENKHVLKILRIMSLNVWNIQKALSWFLWTSFCVYCSYIDAFVTTPKKVSK